MRRRSSLDRPLSLFGLAQASLSSAFFFFFLSLSSSDEEESAAESEEDSSSALFFFGWDLYSDFEDAVAVVLLPLG